MTIATIFAASCSSGGDVFDDLEEEEDDILIYHSLSSNAHSTCGNGMKNMSYWQ
jgi:hypothetical protein